MEDCLAIITARGGSKRIPRKNIREFCGIPILAYSIKAALDAGVFREVMVSTDDEEIAEIARSFGASVPFYRGKDTSNDYATTADVVTEVFHEYEKRNIFFESYCVIYPTAPFITGTQLKNGYQLIEGKSDAAVTVVKFSFPPQRAFIEEKGNIKYKWEENRNARSQDLEPMYQDAGQFYFGKYRSFCREKTLIMNQTAPIILDEMEVQDIDNEVDWKLAELKYKLLHDENEGE